MRYAMLGWLAGWLAEDYASRAFLANANRTKYDWVEPFKYSTQEISIGRFLCNGKQASKRKESVCSGHFALATIEAN